jgi:tetratricopeptide (TPR) repeat protein
MKADYALQGRWREMLSIQRAALSRIPTSLQNSSLRARLLGSFAVCWVLAGRYYEAEYNLRESLEISNKLGETDIGGLLRDMAYTLGIQGKYNSAEEYFAQSIEVADRYKEELQRATALTFWSAVSISEGKIDQANRFLQEAIAIKTTAEPIGLIELFCYLGKLQELTLQWNSSENAYFKAL